METYQRLPLKIVKGRGSWVWDNNGKRYLDAVAGIATCSLGHSDKKLSKALISQLRRIQHISNLYQIPEQEELAEWLVKESCADKVFFCNSGAEANEAAIKLARKYGHIKKGIQNPIILSAKSSFHGRTLAAISATGQPKYHKGFEPLVEGFEFFKFNDLNSVKDLQERIEKSGPRIAAILIEPIQGEGGIHPGEKRFFKFLRDLCDKHQILLILDEVQSGMGRTGALWGYENLNIEPDAFTLAKGLGGGHAIGALLVKKNADIFKPGDHASTFGGNPFACKAALTVAKEIKNRKLLKNVIHRGTQLKLGLEKIISNYSLELQEVRGIGLMQGLVIKEKSNLTSSMIVEMGIKEGLLVIGAGSKVLRIVPPLVITKQEINQLIRKLESCLAKMDI